MTLRAAPAFSGKIQRLNDRLEWLIIDNSFELMWRPALDLMRYVFSLMANAYNFGLSGSFLRAGQFLHINYCSNMQALSDLPS